MSEGEDRVDMRQEVEIALDFPIEVDGETHTVLTMRRPKLRDQFKMSRQKGDDFEKGLAMMCDLTGLPQEILLELDQIDAAKIQVQLENFTGRKMT